jgi:hypothetical protein
VVFDFIATSTSTAATIVGGEQAKTILSGISALSNSTRSSANEHVYRGQITSAITKVMDGERTRILGILEGKHSLTVDDYSADDMIRLVNRYHQACSFQYGVQLLLDAAINKAGYDKVIDSINTQTKVSFLRTQVNSPEFQRFTETKRTAMLDTLAQLILQASAAPQAAESTSQAVPAMQP